MKILGLTALVLVFLTSILTSYASAEDGAAAVINSGDTAWVIVSAALVMLMIPGLGLFYAGMARSKNVLATLMHSFFILCLISIQWVLWGYTLSFGPDSGFLGGIVGGFDFLGLKGVGMEANGTIPHYIFMIFQGMFAVITVALITGAFAERIKFSAFVIFSILWATFVYDPLCHWVWGGGWIGEMGALDFAGGTVVHISSGVSALVAVILIGKRKGYPREAMQPHNLTMTLLGTALLWFGWFGFNAGSALAADGTAALAFVTTNSAAAAAGLSWTFIEWLHRGKPTLLGALSGAVAGLVTITPAAGFVGPVSAIIMGFIGGGLCYFAVSKLKPALGYDDSLDVFGIHGIGGIWGAIGTGIFASVGAKGALFGDVHQLTVQVIAVVATIVLAIVVTTIIVVVINLTIGFRVTEEDEVMGLDVSQHGERGYNL